MSAEEEENTSTKEEEGDKEGDDDEDNKEMAVPKERSKEASRRNNERRAATGDAMTSKWCTRCLQDKDLDDYYPNSTGALGRQSGCKVCQSSGQRQTRKGNSSCTPVNSKKKEATRRNSARRVVGGNAATSKWCTICLQDKELRDCPKNATQCRVCLNSAERQRTLEQDGESRTMKSVVKSRNLASMTLKEMRLPPRYAMFAWETRS
jgi:hypothetical protein